MQAVSSDEGAERAQSIALNSQALQDGLDAETFTVCWSIDRDLFCTDSAGAGAHQVASATSLIVRLSVSNGRVCYVTSNAELACAAVPRPDGAPSRRTLDVDVPNGSRVTAFADDEFCFVDDELGYGCTRLTPEEREELGPISQVSGACYLSTAGRVRCRELWLCDGSMQPPTILEVQGITMFSHRGALCVASGRSVHCANFSTDIRRFSECLAISQPSTFVLDGEVTDIEAVHTGACATTAHRDLYCWGSPAFGPVSVDSPDPVLVARDVVDFSIAMRDGFAHVCLRHDRAQVPICSRGLGALAE